MNYWLNVLKNYKTKKIERRIIKEKKLTDLKIKKISNYLIKKKIEDEKLQENLNKFKNKINYHDIININNWEIKNNKNNNKINKLIKNSKSREIVKELLFKYKNHFMELLFKNINKNNNKTFFLNDILKKYMLYDLYKKINIKKIISIKERNTYALNKIVNIILDTRSLKTKVYIMVNNKSVMFSSNGLIFKKLQLKSKKYKKSEKLAFVFLKNILMKFNFFKKFKNIIISIKGLKKNTSTLVNYINKNIKNNLNNIIYINNYKFSKNKFFKFKKLKAIKKKIKKKIIKYK